MHYNKTYTKNGNVALQETEMFSLKSNFKPFSLPSTTLRPTPFLLSPVQCRARRSPFSECSSPGNPAIDVKLISESEI